MKSKIKLKLVISIIIAIFAFSFFSPVLAQETTEEESGTYNFKTQSGLDLTADEAGYSEANKQATIEDRISRVINTVLIVLGILFLGFLVYGGITWMTAFGNQEKVARATEIITEALVGMIIVFAAYAISWFIFKYFIDGTISVPIG